LSYSPVCGLRDKDSNLDLRVQSAVSWPLDDPGKKSSMSRHVGDTTMLFKPLAHASTLDHTTLPLPRVIVEAFWSPALYSRP
jgi:hypothetical protein